MRVSFFTDEISEDFDEAVRLGAEAGATSADIRWKLFGKSVHEITDEDAVQIQSILNRYGVTVASIGSPFCKCRHDDPDEIETHRKIFGRMVELSKMFGTSIIRGFGFWDPAYRNGCGSTPIEESLETIVPLLRPAAEIAATEGLKLAFEMEVDTFIATCRDARLVIDALGGEGVGICWDVNNAAGAGELPLPDGYYHARGLVEHVHVKPDSEQSIATVADTKIGYRDVLRTLEDDGYVGAIGIEHWGSRELMLSGICQVRSLIDTL